MAEERRLTLTILELAREAVARYLQGGEVMAPPETLPRELSRQAGVFVSLHKGRELRGCIGTISPQQKTIAHEIIQNAISSAFRDPRFPPVEPSELAEMTFSVDILGKAEPVSHLDQLDHKRYGVIVKAGGKSGLLLPDIAGVESVQEQIAIAMRKAGIAPSDQMTLFRFTVERHGKK